eukprot:144417-Amphidinium_carterae.3
MCWCACENADLAAQGPLHHSGVHLVCQLAPLTGSTGTTVTNLDQSNLIERHPAHGQNGDILDNTFAEPLKARTL